MGSPDHQEATMEWIRRRRSRRRAFIKSYAFPSALRVKLREHFEDEHQVDVALEGLREWYLACLSAPGETLGMPSRVVDIAWHEMILMTRTYYHFCERAFGRYLHHSPEAVMDEPMRHSLGRTLAALESQSLMLGGVPLLFAIDGELGLEDGFSWAQSDLDQLRIDHQRHANHGGGHAAFYGDSPGGGESGSSCGGGCGGGGCGGGG
jgi:hypothetical protein